MNESQVEQLQKELEDLRRKSERRSFKQVLKDGYDKVRRTMYYGPNETLESWIIALFTIISAISIAAMCLVAFIVFTVETNGLILLLLPIYPLYLIFRKPQ
jgi:hypothetical protein